VTFLDGAGAALFGELFAGEYLPGSLRTNADAYDNRGNLTRGGDAVDCRVQVERATEAMRQAEGYTANDRAVFVLARPGGGLPDIDALGTNHEITVQAGPYAGQTYKVGAPIDRDPAGAYWLCRGVQTKGSANG
jgi:hypothetical protein